MVAVNILDVEDRVHFVNLALGRDHPIGNFEVVDKAPAYGPCRHAALGAWEGCGCQVYPVLLGTW